MSAQVKLFSKHRETLVIIGVVLACLIGAKKIYDMQMLKIDEVKTLIRSEEEKALSLERIIVLDEDLKVLRENGWPETDFASVVDTLSQLGDASGVRIRDITPRARVDESYLIAIPFFINSTATFHDLAKFLLDVRALPRLMRIREVTLAPETSDSSGKQEMLLRVDIKGEALYFK